MKVKFKCSQQNEVLFNLLGHVRFRVFISDDLYLDVGRFSIGILSRLRLFTNGDFTGLVATVGDYCEFSECDILLGGEHKNSDVINANFSSSPVFQKLLVSTGLDVRHSRKGMIKIGNGVVVGYGASILSGVSIGDGALIAAATVVTRPCEEFGVYAGNPNKLIKYRNIDREAFERFMRTTVHGAFRILTCQSTIDEEDDRSKSARCVIRVQYLDPIKGGPFTFEILGVLVNDCLFKIRNGSEFHRYCAQLNLPIGQEMIWVSNPLDLPM